jgi:2-methylcitrate dehydratase PrpD
MSSGLLVYLNEGVQTKPVHAGWAAHGGVIAALLAANGAEGPRGVLEGRYGLYDAFTGVNDADIATQVADLGERWETLNVSAKPYPACHYMHGSLGATASLLDSLSADQIERVEVTVPDDAVGIVCEPEAEKHAPRTDYDAKFSIQYSTAAMLLDGRVGLDTYSERRRADPDVQELASRVGYTVKPFATQEGAFPGGVRVHMRDGRVLEAECAYQLGAPENPLSEEQVRAKFRDNVAMALDPAAVDALEDAICSLEHHDQLSAIFSLLTAHRVAC